MEKERQCTHPLFYPKFLCWKLKGVQPGVIGEGQKETVSVQGSRSSETVSAEAALFLTLLLTPPELLGLLNVIRVPRHINSPTG